MQPFGTGGREVDEESEWEKGDRIFPTRSHRFPYSPILPANSRYFLSAPLLWDKDFQIRSHCVPFLLFQAFGQALPLRLLADTSRGAVRSAQASSTIDRTHDHMLSKTKRLGKRQMSSGYPNAIVLGRSKPRSFQQTRRRYHWQERRDSRLIPPRYCPTDWVHLKKSRGRQRQGPFKNRAAGCAHFRERGSTTHVPALAARPRNRVGELLRV